MFACSPRNTLRRLAGHKTTSMNAPIRKIRAGSSSQRAQKAGQGSAESRSRLGGAQVEGTIATKQVPAICCVPSPGAVCDMGMRGCLCAFSERGSFIRGGFVRRTRRFVRRLTANVFIERRKSIKIPANRPSKLDVLQRLPRKRCKRKAAVNSNQIMMIPELEKCNNPNSSIHCESSEI